MAYRSADHERWKSLDFVVGVEIQTSNNHTTKDSRGGTKPLEDICDTLAGRYPKGFKFVGWHPHCRCIATTILKTEEEMEADTERIMNGEEPLSPDTSENYIGNTPWRFNNCTAKNLKRIETARQNGTLPYFIKDNENYITIKELGNALLDTAKGTAGVDWSELEKAIKKGDIAEIRKQIDAVSLKVDKDITIEDGYVRLTAKQAAKLSKGQSITKSEDSQIRHYYIGHNESWDLNDNMRFDANGIYDPIPNTTSLEDVSNRLKPISQSMIDTANALDSVISKNSLNFPVRVVRMVAIEMVENMAGMRGKPYSSPYSRDVSGTYNKLQKLGKFTMREGGYMSVSFDPSANAMKGRAAMLVIDLPTGTNIYVTDNSSESEGILGRGRQLLSNRIEIGKIQNGKSTNDVLRIYCRPR